MRVEAMQIIQVSDDGFCIAEPLRKPPKYCGTRVYLILGDASTARYPNHTPRKPSPLAHRFLKPNSCGGPKGVKLRKFAVLVSL